MLQIENEKGSTSPFPGFIQRSGSIFNTSHKVHYNSLVVAILF